MDESGRARELARLVAELNELLTQIARLQDRAAALAEQIDRIDGEDEEDATVHELLPQRADVQLAQLRQAHAGWHIWHNGEGWHAVQDAWSDPVTAETAGELGRLLGPEDPK